MFKRLSCHFANNKKNITTTNQYIQVAPHLEICEAILLLSLDGANGLSGTYMAFTCMAHTFARWRQWPVWHIAIDNKAETFSHA
jgi:hypothetical protein